MREDPVVAEVRETRRVLDERYPLAEAFFKHLRDVEKAWNEEIKPQQHGGSEPTRAPRRRGAARSSRK